MTTYIQIPNLPAARPLNGAEQLEAVQTGVSTRVTTQQIADLASADATFLQAGADAVTRTVTSKLRDTVSVLDFGGAMGGPPTANTTALQAAVATGKIVHIPNGTFMINPTTFARAVRLVGEGSTSILKWAPGAVAANLIYINGVGSSLELRDLTIDGSFADFPVNSGYHATIRCEPTASGFNTRVSVHNVEFINGREFDVWVFGSLTSGAWVKAEFIGCRFRNGVEGQAGTASGCISCNDDVDLLVVGCTFDGPVALNIGRVGIRYQQTAKDVSQQQGSVDVSGNTFRDMGFAFADGSIGGLGSIDVYSGASQVSITGNRVINPRHRGICVKADASDIAITGNVVKGLTGGVFAAACIIAFSSQALGTAGKRLTITGNTCQADHGAGVFIDGADFATDPTAPAFKDVIISSNVIDVDPAGIAPYQIGILVRYCKGVKIIGNTIRRGTGSIIMQSNCSEILTIANNDLRDCSSHAISIGATSYTLDAAITNNFIQGAGGRGLSITTPNSIQITGNTIKDCVSGAMVLTGDPAVMSIISSNTCVDNGFSYTLPVTPTVVEFDNVWDPSPGFSTLSRTIDAGEITITGEMHYVDTEGSAPADDLTVVKGGRIHQLVTLYPASSARAVTVKTSANLVLPSDFVMYTSGDNITLRRTTDTILIEVARVTAGASAASGFIGGNVALDNTATYFDGPSLTITKGTWLITAPFAVSQSSAGPDLYSLILYNVTAAANASIEYQVVSTGINAATAGVACVTITVVANTVITLRAKDTTSVNGSLLNHGSAIFATRAG